MRAYKAKKLGIKTQQPVPNPKKSQKVKQLVVEPEKPEVRSSRSPQRSQDKKPEALKLPPRLPVPRRLEDEQESESEETEKVEEVEETEEAENSRDGQHQRVGLNLNLRCESVGPVWSNRENFVDDLAVGKPETPHNEVNPELAQKAAAMDNNEQPDVKASDTSDMIKSAKSGQKKAHKPKPVRVYQSSGDDKKSDSGDKLIGNFGSGNRNFSKDYTGRVGGFGADESKNQPAEGRRASINWLWLLLALVAEVLSKRKKFLMG